MMLLSLSMWEHSSQAHQARVLVQDSGARISRTCKYGRTLHIRCNGTSQPTHRMDKTQMGARPWHHGRRVQLSTSKHSHVMPAAWHDI